jgi:hypothetical protein
MPFLDKLSSFAQNAVDSTKDKLETSKLHSVIGAERTKIAELHGKIGAYYYARYASGAALDDEPAGLCAEIKGIEEKIAAIEGEIAEIQAKKEEAQRAAEAAKAAQASQSAQTPQPAPVPQPVASQPAPIPQPVQAAQPAPIPQPAASQPIPQPVQTPPPEQTAAAVCPACGEANLAAAKFCHACGGKLEPPAV